MAEPAYAEVSAVAIDSFHSPFQIQEVPQFPAAPIVSVFIPSGLES